MEIGQSIILVNGHLPSAVRATCVTQRLVSFSRDLFYSKIYVNEFVNEKSRKKLIMYV